MNWEIIKTEKTYQLALLRLEEIYQPKNMKEQAECDLLVLLIGKYEEEHFLIPEADPIQVIKMKMDYLELKQKDMLDCFGSKGTASKVLNYRSPLTLSQIWKICEKLKLPIEILAKKYELQILAPN